MTDLSHLFQALAAGERVNERDFDLIFPKEARKFSRAHWTPLVAAVRAAALLVAKPGAKILDVGSGAGKVCVAGVLTTQGHFTGIELDEELVGIAKDLAKTYKLPRLKFLCSDALEADWSAFDGLYFFNPFAEWAATEGQFVVTIQRVREKFEAMPSKARVVTFHGFGGQMPPGYVQEEAEVIGPGVLQLWVKT